MAEWMERAKRLGAKSDEENTIDRKALAKRISDDAAATAAQLEQQAAFSREIARGAVSSTLMVLSQAIDDKLVQPMVEEHHKRMISVSTEINTERIVVNILSLSNGQIRLTCYCGADGNECEHDFDLTATNEAISSWLGGCLVDFFERRN